jgi:hypothetical protein
MHVGVLRSTQEREIAFAVLWQRISSTLRAVEAVGSRISSTFDGSVACKIVSTSR